MFGSETLRGRYGGNGTGNVGTLFTTEGIISLLFGAAICGLPVNRASRGKNIRGRVTHLDVEIGDEWQDKQKRTVLFPP